MEKVNSEQRVRTSSRASIVCVCIPTFVSVIIKKSD